MGSVLERLDVDVQIPYDEEALLSGNPQKIADYMRELVKAIQDRFEENAEITNYGVDLNDGEALYLGLKNSAGEYPNGTWRLIMNGDNLERQVKIAGTWTFAGAFERPI